MNIWSIKSQISAVTCNDEMCSIFDASPGVKSDAIHGIEKPDAISGTFLRRVWRQKANTFYVVRHYPNLAFKPSFT